MAKEKQITGTVTISKNEYIELCVAAETLYRLQGAGVDNWDCYGEALYPDGEQSIKEWEKEKVAEIELR